MLVARPAAPAHSVSITFRKTEMLWLPSPLRGIWDAAVPTMALPGASSTEAEDGRGQPGGLLTRPRAALPMPRRILGEDPG